jgi:hypothetical protein
LDLFLRRKETKRALFLLCVRVDRRRRSKRSRTINRGEEGDEERVTDDSGASTGRAEWVALAKRLERDWGASMVQEGSQ